MRIFTVSIRYGADYQDTIMVGAFVVADNGREALLKYLDSKPGIDDIRSVHVTETDQTEIIK